MGHFSPICIPIQWSYSFFEISVKIYYVAIQLFLLFLIRLKQPFILANWTEIVFFLFCCIHWKANCQKGGNKRSMKFTTSNYKRITILWACLMCSAELYSFVFSKIWPRRRLSTISRPFIFIQLRTNLKQYTEIKTTSAQYNVNVVWHSWCLCFYYIVPC